MILELLRNEIFNNLKWKHCKEFNLECSVAFNEFLQNEFKENIRSKLAIVGGEPYRGENFEINNYVFADEFKMTIIPNLEQGYKLTPIKIEI